MLFRARTAHSLMKRFLSFALTLRAGTADLAGGPMRPSDSMTLWRNMRRGSPLDIDILGLSSPGGVVCDIVYTPLETDLLRRARLMGMRVADGLGMLLHQAVPGFEKWFGVRPEVTPELRALIVADL